MGQDVRNDSRFCQIPSGSKKSLNQHLKPRTIFMAVSLTLIMTTTGLVYYLMQPLPVFLEPWEKRNYVVRTPHSAIAIDGDANFSATALLEGWLGDGSPGNPFIIEGLVIGFGGSYNRCISISNTRVSFVISNCNLTGAEEFGIFLENVTNGELVSNTCSNNRVGIVFCFSEYITVAKNNCSNNGGGIGTMAVGNCDIVNNTCNNNTGHGIELTHSSSSTIANNTCNNNTEHGIYLDSSVYNTVANNACNSNTECGICVDSSCPSTSNNNTISANTCNYSRIGIYSGDLSNIVADNTCLGNTEHDIFGVYITEEAGTGEAGTEEFNPIGFLFVGFSGIIILGAAWRMLSGRRKYY
ncbi:MAG: nitrous oxide reductase family maturation protein NosD [Candidatus Thorarchaeota archaeon]